MMDITQAQRDMRESYFHGATGVLTSSLAWCGAGVVSLTVSPEKAVWALFIGGALIHPVSVLMDKLLGRSGKNDPGNPLGALALASTFWLIFCLPVAYGVAAANLSWFFPAMLLIIGGRYLTFAIIFGLKIYWALGAGLAGMAYVLFKTGASPTLGAFAGSTMELTFAGILFFLAIRDKT